MFQVRSHFAVFIVQDMAISNSQGVKMSILTLVTFKMLLLYWDFYLEVKFGHKVYKQFAAAQLISSR